jgi:hypothetical protein
LVLAALSYSFEWYFIRNLWEYNYSAFEITFGRTFFAWIIILLFFLIFKRDFFKIKIWWIKNWWVIFMFVILAIFANTSINYALKITSVANVIIITYLSVFWWYLLGIIFFNKCLITSFNCLSILKMIKRLMNKICTFIYSFSYYATWTNYSNDNSIFYSWRNSFINQYYLNIHSILYDNTCIKKR